MFVTCWYVLQMVVPNNCVFYEIKDKNTCSTLAEEEEKHAAANRITLGTQCSYDKYYSTVPSKCISLHCQKRLQNIFLVGRRSLA